MTENRHIVFCGYTRSAEVALKELTTEGRRRGIVVLSRKKVPQMEGVTHLAMDFLNIDNLRNKRVALDKCAVCVIFAESRGDEMRRIVDMNTVLTVYNVKKENPNVHVIAEIFDKENTSIVNDLNCDDVVFKETLDFSLITSCILHPNISPIIYDLLTAHGKLLKQATLAEIGLVGPDITYRDVRCRGLEQDVTYLGYISPAGRIVLTPPNDEKIPHDCRLVCIKDAPDDGNSALTIAKTDTRNLSEQKPQVVTKLPY